ncbi:MAG TPA: hypothetical protein VJ775_06215 [Sphingomicrobium sp.]|nr:hypothetical protein [Sphingomicrobium sp.]
MLDSPPYIPVNCVAGANLEETTVAGLYGGCWRDLFIWVWQAYDLTDESWNSAGLLDACNVTLPFAKVVNAAFLINYALSDNLALQWHSTEDYRSSSRAADNRFHGPFYLMLSAADGTAAEARASTRRFLARDLTRLFCRLFSLNAASDSASNRASVLCHESWHHWQYEHGFDTSHPQAGTPPADVDWFYPHRVSDFDFGQLDRYDTDPNHLLFHSPYQIAVEFDADLAEVSQPWVPLVVTQTARAFGNTRLGNQFRNAVAYRIGNPRPF